MILVACLKYSVGLPFVVGFKVAKSLYDGDPIAHFVYAWFAPFVVWLLIVSFVVYKNGVARKTAGPAPERVAFNSVQARPPIPEKISPAQPSVPRKTFKLPAPDVAEPRQLLAPKVPPADNGGFLGRDVRGQDNCCKIGDS
jgi:hypothetical protein